MLLHDNHLHTTFSGDGKFSPDEMIEAAIEKGLKTITFTDHLDLDYNYDDGTSFVLDFASYIPEILRTKEKYKSDIEILLGIELGLQTQLAKIHENIISSYPFDYVIGSLHVAHGVDPYYPEYFEGRTEEAAYREYFEATLENIKAFHGFDALGHLDYVVRYGPEKDRHYSYEKYADIIDIILKALIVEDIALEANSGSFRKGIDHPNPTEDIIRKYIELGGQKITIGADAHKKTDIAADYDKLEAVLRGCGISQYCVFRDRKPAIITI